MSRMTWSKRLTNDFEDSDTLTEIGQRIMEMAGALVFAAWRAVVPRAGWFSPGMLLVVSALALGAVATWTLSRINACKPVRMTREAMLASCLEFTAFASGMIYPLRALGRIIGTSVAHLVVLGGVLALPFCLLALWLTPLEHWLQYRPFRPGEQGVIVIRTRPGRAAPVLERVALHGEAAVFDGPPSVNAEAGETAWRVLAVSEGIARLSFGTEGRPVGLDIPVGTMTFPTPAHITPGSLWGAHWPRSIRSIQVYYPRRNWWIAGFRTGWQLPFMLLAAAFSIALSLVRRIMP